MPYREPIFFQGGYYHVYSRGTEKRSIFLDKADRERFLQRLKEYKDKHKVAIICYCLMSNHYHLLVKQTTEETISKFVYRLNLAYAMYFNKRYERVGPLFQGRFKAKNIDNDEYLVHLSRYIHLNPLEVDKKIDITNYPWSSFQYYTARKYDGLVDTNLILSSFGEKDPKMEYLEFVRAEEEDKLKLMMEKLLFEELHPFKSGT